jgi:hypothetical protein
MHVLPCFILRGQLHHYHRGLELVTWTANAAQARQSFNLHVHNYLQGIASEGKRSHALDTWKADRQEEVGGGDYVS